MDQLAAKLWNPWLAAFVVGVAALFTLALLAPQLTAWRRIKGMLRPRADEDPPPLLLLYAASAGLGSIAGTALALSLAGPGAVMWTWIAIALGLALHFAEGVLGSRRPDDRTPPPIHVLAAPGIGKLLAPFFAIGVIAVGVVIGGMLQTGEAAAVLEQQSAMSGTTIAIAIAVVAAPCVFAAGVRRLLLQAVPFVVALYAVLALWVAFSDPLLLELTMGDAVNQAFGVDPVLAGAAGGGVAVMLAHGVARAALGGGTGGLGAAALAGIRADHPAKAGALAMLAALGSAGVLSIATGLLVLGGGSGRAVVAGPQLVPLEQPESRGLRPSQQVGQTIVLPEGTTMTDASHYAMILRSNPRGHAWGKLDKERNAVVLPHWTIAQSSDAIVFRSLTPTLADEAAWDVRIPCDREVREAPGGAAFLKLTPKDPNIKLGPMIAQLGLDPTPYVVFDDFHFTGRVAKANSPDPALGEHLAMYEPPMADRPPNPTFHEFFRAGYRGPYPDDGSPRPPWTMVASEDFQPAIGRVLKMRFSSGPRGAAAVQVTKSGGIEGPPWAVLLDAKTIVLRHTDDPARDVHIPATPRLDGPRVRFDIADPAFQDMRSVLKNDPKLQGPFVITRDLDFEVEVHGDTRLPQELKGRRALVPLHDLGEPRGPAYDEEPSTPHPGSLLAAGFVGPYLAQDGTQIVAGRFDDGLGSFGRAAIAIVVIVLAVAAITAHGELVSRAATALLGSMGAMLGRAAVVVAAACGTIPSRWELLTVSELLLAILLGVSVLGLLLLLTRVRAASKG
jgi:Na+/alanine symporter